MNKFEFNENSTNNSFSKNSFVYDFLSSLRQKINAPIKKKKTGR